MHNVYVYKISKTYFSNSIQTLSALLYVFNDFRCLELPSSHTWTPKFCTNSGKSSSFTGGSTNCEVMHVFLRDSLYVVFVHLFNNKLTCAGFPGYECKDSTCPRELRTCGTKTRSICQKFQWSVLLSRFRGELCDQGNVETKSRYTHSNLNDSEDK